MVFYAMPFEGSKFKHIQLRFPAFAGTVISLDSLNIFTLCVILGERPKFLAILH